MAEKDKGSFARGIVVGILSGIVVELILKSWNVKKKKSNDINPTFTETETGKDRVDFYRHFGGIL